MNRLVIALCLLGGGASAACAPDRVALIGDWGRAEFRVEVADDAAERAQGLMFVEQMPTSAGMLFIYESPRSATFWMRNTLIPLDMIFADTTGRIQTVHSNAIPHDETPIPGGDDIHYVLEINGGLAERIGIAPGDQMMHPAIAPCE